jgi:hypothetical protein
VLCFYGDDCVAACERSGSDDITLLSGGWYCSDTRVPQGGAVAFSLRCDLLLLISYQRGVTLGSVDFYEPEAVYGSNSALLVS